MVDKCWMEINALNTVFPDSQVLLCWFHVAQVSSVYIIVGIT